MASERILRRIEQLTDFPLLILAILLVPIIVLPWLIEPTPGMRDLLSVADWIIWAIFAVVFLAKLIVAPRKLSYLYTHWFEVALVTLPFLQPLRVARLLRFVRVFRLAALFGFNNRVLQRLASQRGVRFAAAIGIVVIVVGASAALLAERSDESANITSFDDALWWAATTTTTVGYGDTFPVTPMGRGIAIALMLFGISIVSVLTATIAAFIVRDGEDVKIADLMVKLEAIEQRLDAALNAREARAAADDLREELGSLARGRRTEPPG